MNRKVRGTIIGAVIGAIVGGIIGLMALVGAIQREKDIETGLGS